MNQQNSVNDLFVLADLVYPSIFNNDNVSMSVNETNFYIPSNIYSIYFDVTDGPVTTIVREVEFNLNTVPVMFSSNDD